MSRFRVKFKGCSAAFLSLEDTIYLEAADNQDAFDKGQIEALARLGFDGQLEKLGVREVNENNQLIGSPLEVTFRTSCPDKRKKAAAAKRRRR